MIQNFPGVVHAKINYISGDFWHSVSFPLRSGGYASLQESLKSPCAAAFSWGKTEQAGVATVAKFMATGLGCGREQFASQS